MYKVAKVAGIEVMFESATWTSTHQSPSGYDHSWVPAAETNTESQCGTINPGLSASYLMTGWLQWTASTMEGAVFCSYRNRHSGYISAFPVLSASAKTTPWTYRTPYPPSLYSIQYCSWPRNSFHNEVRQCVCAHGTHWSYHIPHHPKVANLTEQWNGLLNTQL